MRQALSDARPDFDADDPAQLRLFAHDQLATAVQEVLGPDLVDMVLAYVEDTCRATPVPPSPKRAGATTAPQPRQVVLLISDDDEVHRDIGAALIRFDLPMTTCRDSAVAVAECLSVEPSVIIYDAALHGNRPSRFTTLLGKAMGPSAPPVIVLSVPPTGGIAAAAVVAKPLIVGELHRALTSCGVDVDRTGGSDSITPPLESGARPVRHPPPPAPPVSMRSPFVHLLDEAVRVVANEDVAEHLIETALAMSSLTRVPSDADAFARFAIDSLYDVIMATLGEDSADMVIAGLRPIIDQAKLSSGIRKSSLVDPDEPPFVPETLPPAIDDQKIAVLVDDDRAVLRSLQRGLEHLGYRVIVATDGHAALGLCARHQPDVVVVDLHMPAVGGRQLIALMARTFGANAAPVVVLTGDRRAPRHMEGARAVLYKPVSVEALAKTLDRIAGRSRAASGR